ncbi:hypothetical protein [Chamaesiphon sp.]|uniref:hypothetical protein n=1 Tax=Chamaesiphon sp. TaxID=2814140 RepID=UPI0035930C00
MAEPSDRAFTIAIIVGLNGYMRYRSLTTCLMRVMLYPPKYSTHQKSPKLQLTLSDLSEYL